MLQPYMYGLDDPKRTRLTGSLFNGRKVCGVFTAGAFAPPTRMLLPASFLIHVHLVSSFCDRPRW
jgi:hypothetical protein